MRIPQTHTRPGFIYATARLKFGILEKEDVLMWMIGVATLKSSGIETAFMCLAIPSFFLYLYKRFTAHLAPGAMKFATADFLSGLHKTPYIGFMFQNLSDLSASQWRDNGSIVPPSYKNHYEP